MTVQGIKVTDRGEWILDKWNKRARGRKGFVKIHLAVNVKTKRIVSMSVTKENVHDGRMLKELVCGVCNNNNKKTKTKTKTTTKNYWQMVPMNLKITLGILRNQR